MKAKLLALLLTFSLLQISVGNVFATSPGPVGIPHTPTPVQGPQGSCGKDSIETALGCISTTVEGANSFFITIINVAVGLGGGLALLLMLYGTFIVTTSAGMPDKLKEGKEIITSAIAGLVFIILSVFLLRLIGVNILGLPGLE